MSCDFLFWGMCWIGKIFCRTLQVSHAMSDSRNQKWAEPSRCAVTTGWAPLFSFLSDGHECQRTRAELIMNRMLGML